MRFTDAHPRLCAIKSPSYVVLRDLAIGFPGSWKRSSKDRDHPRFRGVQIGHGGNRTYPGLSTSATQKRAESDHREEGLYIKYCLRQLAATGMIITPQAGMRATAGTPSAHVAGMRSTPGLCGTRSAVSLPLQTRSDAIVRVRAVASPY